MTYSSVPVPFIDAQGYHLPAFVDIRDALQSDYRGIYGQDIPFDNGDQDTQWLGITATAFNDAFALGLAVYNAFAPSTAQGTGLSSVIKVNGITRGTASYSTTTVTVVGRFGLVLTGQSVGDGVYTWSLPSPVIIPLSGTIDVTAICTVLGAVKVSQGTVGQLLNPTLGLKAITCSGVAAPGAPVESDPTLRVRQAASTGLAARGIVDGIYGAILALANVARARVYENDTNALDANSIPGHAISAVVDGGDAVEIAAVIAQRKLSSGTYGTTAVTVVTGSAQIPRTISFFRPIEPPIAVIVNVKAYAGFTLAVETQIAQAISDYVNGLGIGAGQFGKIMVSRVYGPALLTGTVAANTFEITSIAVGRDGNTPTPADVLIAFNEAPVITPDLVTVSPS